MAEKDPTMGGLGGFGNINTYGMTQDQLEKYNQEIEKNIGALEQRYAQPNWFKIAAGFAKPQLGGFLSSLGSAAEAHGETVEQQRAMGLPIAKMRTELAQTGLLLTNKKKASEISERARRENRSLTPQELEEIANLDPQRGQMLTQAQDTRAKTVANNMAITKQNYEAMGQPMPKLNEMGLPDTGEFPTGGGEQKNANPARIMPPPQQLTPFPTLPNGARVNEDQKRLHELGIPIISGMRTKDEQQALYDNRANNPNPVAAPGTSTHETGNAVDVDPSKPLTPEQKGMLKALGYTQPYANDLNHWEKVSAKGAPTQTGATQGNENVLHFMPDTSPTNPYKDQAELQKQQLLEQNKEYATQFSALNKMIGPTSALGNRTISASNSLMDLLAYDPKDDYVGKDGKKHNYKEEQLNRVIGPLSQGGVLNAAMASAAKGFGVTTPFGAAEINVPFETLLKKLVPKEDQTVAEKIATNVAVIKLWQQQHTGQSLGNMPVGEFSLMDAASPSPSSTLSALRYNAAKAHNNVHSLKDVQKDMEEIINGRHSKYKLSKEDKPIAFYSAFNSPAARERRDEFLKNEKDIDQMSEAQSQAERRSRKSKP